MKVIRCCSLVFALLLLLSCLPAGAARMGDLDGDGAVDSADAIYLLYHTLLGDAMYPLSQPADYTQDGVEDISDAVYLLYHTMLPTIYPLSLPVNLPDLGYDPDGKGRIQLSALSLDGNTVTATFTNNSRTWLTDEASYIYYTCTDASGRLLSSSSYYLGYVPCGESVTNTITLPAGTKTLKFTGASINYWSQWIQ